MEIAKEHGHEVSVLGRSPAGNGGFQSWSLGDLVSTSVFESMDAVIHLAHSWAADARGEAQLNGDASEALAKAALAAGVPRFVFASTNSARAEALNLYGREKFRTEERLAQLPGASGRLISARIGLVYGGEPQGQYAMMRKITRLTPFLPFVGLERLVQPIHLDEVCIGLLTLATRPDLDQPVYILAGAPMRFGTWLKLLRRVQTGTGLTLLSLPLAPVLALSRLGPGALRERLLGLAGASPMDSEDSRKALGLVLTDPEIFLDETLEAEHRALLTYMGASMVTPIMLRDLARGIMKAGIGRLGLSPWLLRRPSFIILVEPPANRRKHRLGMALHLASQIVAAHQGERPRHKITTVAKMVFLDILVRPLRLLIGGRYR